MQVEMQQVESSTIESMGHDEAMTMYVKFKRGGFYEYQNVSFDLFSSILLADSIGSTFNSLIKTKPLIYPYKKVV